VEILEVFDQINRWIEESMGELIDIGLEDRCCFSRRRLFEESELRSFEERENLILPTQYRDFLKSVGSSRLFAIGGSGIDILEPSEIREWSQAVFDNYGDDPYPDLMLAVSMPRWGYFGGFQLAESEEENYSVFFPEVPPELWIEEADFLAFNEWIARVVESKAKWVS
jgi:hypothetical protein